MTTSTVSAFTGKVLGTNEIVGFETIQVLGGNTEFKFYRDATVGKKLERDLIIVRGNSAAFVPENLLILSDIYKVFATLKKIESPSKVIYTLKATTNSNVYVDPNVVPNVKLDLIYSDV